jgi:hypothetical protein
MIIRLFVIVAMLLSPALLHAQQAGALPMDSGAVAADELEAIIAETGKLDNKNAVINIRARAAMLVSFSDPSRSESMFLEIWKLTGDQTDETFDKDGARLLILRYMYLRNPKLARRLLSEQAKLQDSSSPTSPTRRDDLAGKLGAQLVDTDPTAAAALLERSLLAGATPAGLSGLFRLREKDPILSDYVASRYLDGLVNQPSIASLSGLFLTTAYVFPGPEAPIFSPDAESSLQILQYRYFMAGCELLRTSLTETDEALIRDHHYSERDLQFRAANQGQVAAILAALAPRFQPSLVAELNGIAGRLASQVPANISQLTKFALARLSGNQVASDNPEENFVSSLSSGDFDEARKQLDRVNDERKRNLYNQLLIKNEARSLLAKSDVMGALTAIRKLDDPTTRLVMYLDALKTTKKKQDSNLTSIVINEARLLIPSTERNGLHLRVLLSFVSHLAKPATKSDALEFLTNAVVTINALGKKSNGQNGLKSAETAMEELNDPINLLDAAEMEQAFTMIGKMDLDSGLALAKMIEPKPAQLVARLETLQGVIKREVLKPTVPAKTPKSTTKTKG